MVALTNVKECYIIPFRDSIKEVCYERADQSRGLCQKAKYPEGFKRSLTGIYIRPCCRNDSLKARFGCIQGPTLLRLHGLPH